MFLIRYNEKRTTRAFKTLLERKIAMMKQNKNTVRTQGGAAFDTG